jgi:hypothetical protein
MRDLTGRRWYQDDMKWASWRVRALNWSLYIPPYVQCIDTEQMNRIILQDSLHARNRVALPHTRIVFLVNAHCWSFLFPTWHGMRGAEISIETSGVRGYNNIVPVITITARAIFKCLRGAPNNALSYTCRMNFGQSSAAHQCHLSGGKGKHPVRQQVRALRACCRRSFTPIGAS